MYSEKDVNVSKYIVEILEEKGIMHKRLAKELGVTKSTMSYKLRGDTFTAKELEYIANFLDIDLNIIRDKNSDD